MKKQYFLFPLLILFCFPSNPGFSQDQQKIDSLLLLFEDTKEDMTRANILNRLSHEYWNRDPEKSLDYASQALTLSEKLGYKQEIAMSLNNIGAYYEDQGGYLKAIGFYQQSLKIMKELKNSPDEALAIEGNKGIAMCLNNIGQVNRLQGNYTEAANYLLQSLKIYEELGNKKGSASVLNNIGIIYGIQSNYDKAIEYFLRSIKIKKEIGNKQDIAVSLNNIGSVFYYQGDYEQAIDYFVQALKTKEKIGDQKGIAICLNNIGEVFTDQGDHFKAIEYFMKSLKIAEQLGDRQGIALKMNNIGKLYAKMGKYELAIGYSKGSLSIAKEIGAKDVTLDAYQSLAKTYSQQSQFKMAYEYYQLYSAMKDTLFNKESSNQITEMQTKYETEKKDEENVLLTKQTEIQALQLSRNRYLIYGLAGVTLLLMVIGFLFIQQNKLRTEQRTMQAEQRLLRSQMNPHFISNSLMSIQSFIYKKDPKEAGKYLARFAKLMRLILENSREEYVPLEKEIKTLEYYLELQALRFENKFDYTINVDSELDTEAIAIPPMLAQPFIENAIEHGLLHKDKGGYINVHIKLNGDLLLFEVEDNGIGRQKAAELKSTEQKEHQSLATTITQERLAILNKRNRQKIELQITDLKSPDGDVTGTRATFHIPYRNV